MNNPIYPLSRHRCDCDPGPVPMIAAVVLFSPWAFAILVAVFTTMPQLVRGLGRIVGIN